MAHTIRAERTITADAAIAWAALVDVDGWPTWDPHEEAAHLDGPLRVGAVGWSKPRGAPGTHWTVTELVEGRRWSSRCPLPGGWLTGSTEVEDLGGGRLRCTKTVVVLGPLVPLFRLWFGPRIRRDMGATFAALEFEAARRATVER